jgi:GT2 family glycosyltransferase
MANYLHVAIACRGEKPDIESQAEELRCYPSLVHFYSGAEGVLSAYEEAAACNKGVGDVLAYIHDDVEIFEDCWVDRVLKEFEDETVGLVGFGGAVRHGAPHLYKVPYKLTDLARFGYYSNQRDAEAHGTRFGGAMDVAVLDGFALIVRPEVVEGMGGWQPDKWPPHHNYDYRLCAETRRQGYRIRMVGVYCHHHGGKTATSSEYQEWCKTTKWRSDAEMHKAGHRMFYDEYRDVMPWEVGR